MGAYFFNNDIENYTITPNFAFAKNKARFFGTLGIQKNNLAGNRSETTKRAIGNAVLSVNPSPRFGMELNYMNVGVNQREGKALLNDSVRVAVTNSNIGITPHWSFIDSIKSANLVISAQYQQVNDRNPFTREFANMNTKFVTANFIQNFVQNEWGWSAGINFNNIAVYQLNSNRYGITLGCNKSWNDGIGAATFSATYNLSDISGVRDGSVWSLNSTLHWRFGKRVNLSVNANLLRNQSTQFEDYTELQGGISVSRRFGK